MKTNEFLKEDCHEASMARAELVQIAKNAIALAKLIQEGDDLPGWVSSYITLADDHLNSVHEYMEYHSVDTDVLSVAEDASCGGTSSGGIATAIPGGGAGFGKSIFMKRSGTKKAKK
jgi:S-adenosylmethionine/arginine decarboxylase-like enzyme